MYIRLFGTICANTDLLSGVRVGKTSPGLIWIELWAIFIQWQLYLIHLLQNLRTFCPGNNMLTVRSMHNIIFCSSKGFWGVGVGVVGYVYTWIVIVMMYEYPIRLLQFRLASTCELHSTCQELFMLLILCCVVLGLVTVVLDLFA